MWNEIKGYEGLYEINKQGAVRSQHVRSSKRLISTRIDRGGYISLRLSKEGITRTYLLHRLMAETFIPNPDEKLLVNHKNGNKLDYRIKNLEWATHSENTQHAYDYGLIVRRSCAKNPETKSRYSGKKCKRIMGIDYIQAVRNNIDVKQRA